MLVSFVLTMPGIGSWNGKWTGSGNLYAKVRDIPKEAKEIVGKDFRYRWDDGWEACVSVNRVYAKEAARIRKQSMGFKGYDWMIDSIIKNGEIVKPTH